jgi:hypothetical protein
VIECFSVDTVKETLHLLTKYANAGEVWAQIAVDSMKTLDPFILQVYCTTYNKIFVTCMTIGLV